MLLNELDFWKLDSNKKLKNIYISFTKNDLKLLNYLHRLIKNYEKFVL